MYSAVLSKRTIGPYIYLVYITCLCGGVLGSVKPRPEEKSKAWEAASWLMPLQGVTAKLGQMGEVFLQRLGAERILTKDAVKDEVSSYFPTGSSHFCVHHQQSCWRSRGTAAHAKRLSAELGA